LNESCRALSNRQYWRPPAGEPVALYRGNRERAGSKSRAELHGNAAWRRGSHRGFDGILGGVDWLSADDASVGRGWCVRARVSRFLQGLRRGGWAYGVGG